MNALNYTIGRTRPIRACWGEKAGTWRLELWIADDLKNSVVDEGCRISFHQPETVQGKGDAGTRMVVDARWTSQERALLPYNSRMMRSPSLCIEIHNSAARLLLPEDASTAEMTDSTTTHATHV